MIYLTFLKRFALHLVNIQYDKDMFINRNENIPLQNKIMLSKENWYIDDLENIFHQSKLIKLGSRLYKPLAAATNNNLRYVIASTRHGCQNHFTCLLISHKDISEIEIISIKNHQKLNYHLPDSEDIRIINAAQKKLLGISYVPIFCAKDHLTRYYISTVHIQDEIKSSIIVGVQVFLNTLGYYEIQKIDHLLTMKS